MSKSATSTTTATEVPNPSIPLHSLFSNRRYTPSLFSTTSTLPPSYSSYAPSIASTTQDLLPFNTSNHPFTPTTILQIQSVGKDLISLPTSTKELCIPIFACDAEGKTERPKWLSIRPKRGSGSCYLVDAEDQDKRSVARTKYRFGPGKPPVVRIGPDGDGERDDLWEEDEASASGCAADTIRRDSRSTSTSQVDDHGKKSDDAVTTHIAPVSSTSVSTSASASTSTPQDSEPISFPLTSRRLLGRTIAFTSPTYGSFEWRYCSRKEKSTFLSPSNTSSSSSSSPTTSSRLHTTATTNPDNLLVLEKIYKQVDAKGKERETGRVRVAQLIRSDETRTPGSRGGSAGNGGRLECCLERAVRASDEEGEMEVLVDEVTVVVTCLVMLKKEIDRLRGAQIAVMSAGASGGP